MKSKIGLLVVPLLLAACHRNVRLTESSAWDRNQPEENCSLSSNKPVGAIITDANGQEQPAAFEVTINSSVPVEPVDFLGPLDFATSRLQYKIGQVFRTKFFFNAPGNQRVTAVLNNPFSRHDLKCTASFDVRRIELHVSPLPHTASLGQEIPFQILVQGASGEVRFSAQASEGSQVKLDPTTGKGTVKFDNPGRNTIHFKAQASLSEEKGKLYHLKGQEGIDVKLTDPLECEARLSTTKAAADAREGDQLEAVVYPVSDPTLAVEVAGFNPGPNAYDVRISGNTVTWRYQTPGQYEVWGLCRDLGTRRIGKISVVPHRIVAAQPLTAEAKVSTEKPFAGEPVVVKAKAIGGLGRARISYIDAPELAGLHILKSNDAQKWVVRFDPRTPVDVPVKLTVEMRDESSSLGECRPPHCTLVPIKIRLQDPS